MLGEKIKQEEIEVETCLGEFQLWMVKVCGQAVRELKMLLLGFQEFQKLVLIICLLIPKEEDAMEVDFGGDSCRWWQFETRLPGKSKSVLGF